MSVISKEVKKSEASKKITFPILMEAVDGPQCVVLFIDNNIGIRVLPVVPARTSCDEKGWTPCTNESCWRPYTGAVTLSNQR